MSDCKVHSQIGLNRGQTMSACQALSQIGLSRDQNMNACKAHSQIGLSQTMSDCKVQSDWTEQAPEYK